MNDAPPYARATAAIHGGRVEARLAALDRAEASLVLSSGMAAVTCTMLALLRAGDHVVASAWLSGDVRRFFEQELPNLDIDVTFVDPMETRGWRRVTRGNTRLFFLAAPVDATTRIADLNPPRLLAQELGIALIVDSTCASPINFRPIEHGADVVIHSGAACLHSERGMQSGVVCAAEAVIDEVRDKMSMWGHAPDPFALELLDRSLKTLEIRVLRQNENAARVAQWAESHDAIRRVYYPGLASHPDHEVALGLFDGFGGLVVLEVADDDETAARIASRLTLFRRTPLLGGVESVVHLPGESARAHGAADAIHATPPVHGTLRLGVGIEDASDLIADLTKALE